MKKHHYLVYGKTVASDYEFPQFVSIAKPKRQTDIEIEYGGISDKIMEAIRQGEYIEYGSREMWFKNRVGIFWIDEHKISFVEYGGETVDDAAVYLPGMCLSILLWYRNMIMIHGACLRSKDKTLVIAGDSGAGKSSLTTAFINRGAKLIADDVTGIGIEDGEYYSYPAFPAQKLCTDQMEINAIDKTGLRQIRYDNNKFEVPRIDNFYDSKSKVDLFFRIELDNSAHSEDGVEFRTIDGAEKIRVLTDSIFINWMFGGSFRFEPEDMFRCIGFIKDVSVYRVLREIGKDTLDEIIAFVEEQVK